MSNEQATRGSSAALIDAIDEYDIRRWFMTADLRQVADTLNVCRGIVETREQMQPKRVRRRDSGTKRPPSTATVVEHEVAERTLDLREIGQPIPTAELEPPDSGMGGAND